MRTANPALKESVFTEAGYGARGQSESMTINGTVNRTGILILLVIAAAWFSWTRSTPGPNGEIAPNPLIFVGAIGGFILALITIFKKTIAPITAPIYAVLEGLFLGGLSAMFEARFPGIAAQATTLRGRDQ